VGRYQRKDAFHQRAKREGYRSRAAYKLAELADRHAILRPGAWVADLGCWPGGWLQVASERVGAAGRVVGVDLAAIEPPLDHANVIALSEIRRTLGLQRIFAEPTARPMSSSPTLPPPKLT
jgi:23S rRNA U2552 (ribose-2'-O)-methylase RlmE/FtsJ